MNTQLSKMGIFGNFNAIGKIYEHLRKIEPMYNAIMVSQRARTDRAYCNSLGSQIKMELNTIKGIVESSGNTVKCADFQFMGSKKSIYQIIADTEMLTDLALNRPM